MVADHQFPYRENSGAGVLNLSPSNVLWAANVYFLQYWVTLFNKNSNKIWEIMSY
jgi:hypothetical protein